MAAHSIIIKGFAFVILTFSCSKEEFPINRLSNEKTAIVLAEEKWPLAYGTNIYKEKPYCVKKINDSIWIVKGTFSKPMIGGVAYAKVNVKSKKVINYTHGE